MQKIVGFNFENPAVLFKKLFESIPLKIAKTKYVVRK